MVFHGISMGYKRTQKKPLILVGQGQNNIFTGMLKKLIKTKWRRGWTWFLAYAGGIVKIKIFLKYVVQFGVPWGDSECSVNFFK